MTERVVARCAVPLLIALGVGTSGCKKHSTPETVEPALPAAAASSPKPPEPAPAPFRGEAALQHARALAALGARLPGSPGSERARAYLAGQLAAAGWIVVEQAFDAATPEGNASFTNLVARFPKRAGQLPPTDQPIVLGAHYDTSRAAGGAVPGANDGASGPAVLLEIAAALSHAPALARRVELVWFDGREPARQFGSGDGLYGSRFHAARRLETGPVPELAIILGMVGGLEAAYTLTADTPPPLAEALQKSAAAEGVGGRVVAAARPAWDDHLAFLHAGIPALLLTDTAYPFVRTADDTAERLDGDALARTGRVVMRMLADPPAAVPQPSPVAP
jgi:hypothetical protein